MALLLVGAFVSARIDPWNLPPDKHAALARKSRREGARLRSTLRKQENRPWAENLVQIHAKEADIHTAFVRFSQLQGRSEKATVSREIDSMFRELGTLHENGVRLTRDPHEKAMHSTMRSAARQVATGAASSLARKSDVEEVKRATCVASRKHAPLARAATSVRMRKP